MTLLNVDKLQDFLQAQDWYKTLDVFEKLDIVETLCDFFEDIGDEFKLDHKAARKYIDASENNEKLLSEQKGKRWTAEARLLVEKEKSRKLYFACHKAFLWHCGNGTEEAEKDCMNELESAMDEYKKEEI